MNEGIVRQFLLSWDAFHEAMERCTDAVWRLESPPPTSVGRIALHTLESTQRYCRTSSKQRVDLDPFGFGGKALSVPMRDFPSIERVREYSDRVKERVMQWLAGLSEADLTGPSRAFTWTGRSTLEGHRQRSQGSRRDGDDTPGPQTAPPGWCLDAGGRRTMVASTGRAALGGTV